MQKTRHDALRLASKRQPLVATSQKLVLQHVRPARSLGSLVRTTVRPTKHQACAHLARALPALRCGALTLLHGARLRSA